MRLYLLYTVSGDTGGGGGRHIRGAQLMTHDVQSPLSHTMSPVATRTRSRGPGGPLSASFIATGTDDILRLRFRRRGLSHVEWKQGISGQFDSLKSRVPHTSRRSVF